MHRTTTTFLYFAILLLIPAGVVQGDEAKPKPKKSSEKDFSIQITEEVRAALMPLIDSIRDAKVSRATVRMLTDSVMSGEVVESREATFQIAAKNPGKFTVYLKEPEQRTRVYCDGKQMVAAMAPDAFFRLPNAVSIQKAVTALTVPLGPYPEPVLALTMAGCDPSITFVAAMKSIEVVDRKPFKGKIPAIHLHGVQADAVTWDLWVSDDEKDPQPLRLLIDMTPMLAASDQVHVPAGFSYQVRYDFLTWRVKGDLKDNLFTFKPAKGATEYESLEDYFQQIAGSKGYHPLLGQPAPRFKTQTVDQRKFDLKSLKGRVVVVDFWTTTCKACLAGMPTVKKVTDRYSKKGVVLLEINTGQDLETVQDFLKDTGIEMNILMDEEGKIADGFIADAIPQTVLIGKDGLVESVHLGFAGEEALEKRLTDELDVLTVGGRIASGKPAKATKSKSKKD
ncbi:redoxin domain-containing protein [Rubripirellula obstinata]|nr:redoxin domain-containing protein [Rubripirellula obstinata]